MKPQIRHIQVFEVCAVSAHRKRGLEGALVARMRGDLTVRVNGIASPFPRTGPLTESLHVPHARPLPPIVLDVRRHRPDRRRRPPGRPADARRAGLPSAFSRHRDHRAGHGGRRRRPTGRPRTGSPTRRVRPRGHAGRARSRSACSATRANAAAIAAVLDDTRTSRWCSIPCSPRAGATRSATEDMPRRARRAAGSAEPPWSRPNSLEARRLRPRRRRADGANARASAPSACSTRGAKFVLVTGTHEPTPEVVNTLYDARGVVRSDRWQRLPGEYHGSGCTLAAAIAANLAHGARDRRGGREAHRTSPGRRSRDAFRPGSGQAIPDRLFRRAPGGSRGDPRRDGGVPPRALRVDAGRGRHRRARRQGPGRNRRRGGGGPVPQQAGARWAAAASKRSHSQRSAAPLACRSS